MTLTLPTAWMAASWFEAARVRSAEIDLDHLYLGLLSIGGAAARLLGTHGVSLASAREHARAAMTADIDSLGLDVSGLTMPPPLSVHQVIAGDPEFRSTPRAKQLMDKSNKAANTYDLLVELLREPSKTVRRLVHADGIEPQDLVAELKQGADDQYAPRNVPVLDGVLPPPAKAWRVHHYLSAPPEVVAEVIADDAFLSRWAYDARYARADGQVLTITKGSKEMTVRFELDRAERDGVWHIDWVQRMLDTRYAGEALDYNHFEVRPAPGGAELVRDRGRRTFGVLGRAIAPVVDRLQAFAMLHFRYALAFAVADRQADLDR